jgi:hypothetical protein
VARTGGSGSRFAEELNRYLAWLRTGEVGTWTTVVVAERALESNLPRGSSFVPASTFDGRFDEILNFSARDWVNLATEGVLDDGTLLIVVEYFSGPVPNRGDCPDEIAVNFSGPERPKPIAGVNDGSHE